MDQNIFGKFSDNIKKVLILAESSARENNTPLDTQHLLFSLSSVKGTLANDLLTEMNLTPDRIKLSISLIAPDKTMRGQLITEDARNAIQQAVLIASKEKHEQIDCEHLLLALISNKEFKSRQVIEKADSNFIHEITGRIETIFSNTKGNMPAGPKLPLTELESFADMPFDEAMDSLAGGDSYPLLGNPTGMPTATKTKKETFLELFTTNLTSLAKDGKLDPVIGRENETLRLSQILSRRTKNNPILVGEPGVGKTSIVEGLAKRISEGKVPSKLVGKELLSLDMGAVIAGTMYRGQFESRIKKILAEVKKKDNIVLFIDEIHTVVGAGATEGSIDAANLFKPMLARGELRLIGSTTFDEYKKHIEKDPAFERRFQPIKISEATLDETIAILNGIKSRYEQHHHVKYTPESLIAAATLSKRYINDRFLPDKAIDLIDEAAAAKDVYSPSMAKSVGLKNELREILRKKDQLIMDEKYQEATLLREKEIRVENEIEKTGLIKRDRQTVTAEDIAFLVSLFTGVPVANLDSDQKKKILNLEKEIKKRIVGQDDVISEVAMAIKRARVGISNPNRPTGSFIFLGPTGVGKSELAKVLAKELLGNEQNLIKIDMSEFMERHNVSRLVGAPAGYIGYEEGGKLTEIVRKNPYSIILLDEIEKAHPEVFNILLQIMEDGILTDAKGRKVDFKNTIIIMTSNLGTDILRRQANIGFETRKEDDEQYEKLKENIIEAVEKHFKPEFINRLDKIVIFRPLSKESIKKIVDIQISDLRKRLTESKLKLKIDSRARNWIAQKGYDPQFGARPIRRVIMENVESQLSEAILAEKFKAGDTVAITLVGDKIVLKK